MLKCKLKLLSVEAIETAFHRRNNWGQVTPPTILKGKTNLKKKYKNTPHSHELDIRDRHSGITSF